jgi:hypothetical protein
VCAGTADAKRALMTDQQLADRFEVDGDHNNLGPRLGFAWQRREIS